MPGHSIHKSFAHITVMLVMIFVAVVSNRFIYWISWWKLALLAIIATTWGVSPDLDMHISKIRKYLFYGLFGSLLAVPILWILYGVVTALGYVIIIGILGLVVMSMKHRGFLHSYKFVLMISLPLLFFGWVYFIVGVVACSSHLWIDKWLSKRKKFNKFIKKLFFS